MNTKWNPKELEIRAMFVEKSLQPLVLQVTTLVNTTGPSKKKKGRSKRAQVLVAAVEKATENFIIQGKQIADENPLVKREMMGAVEEVGKTGDAMSCAAREFAEEPCSSVKRGNMVRAARNLLSAVTKLMIMADMIDVHVLTGAVDNISISSIIDASKLVYEGVSEIRRAVLMKKPTQEKEISEEEIRRADLMKKTAQESEISEEDKKKIVQKVEDFQNEKMKFDREMAKWGAADNDIIILAKHMCSIMMEMTDFTRGRGPLKTTMDIINAAKKISEAGTKLDNLTRKIANQCPEPKTKKDILAYLQQIALYCHQLNITSKVKADVQNISGELVVLGLDSATSLIQAAKNLMIAVVSTVKASYVASNLVSL